MIRLTFNCITPVFLAEFVPLLNFLLRLQVADTFQYDAFFVSDRIAQVLDSSNGT